MFSKYFKVDENNDSIRHELIFNDKTFYFCFCPKGTLYSETTEWAVYFDYDFELLIFVVKDKVIEQFNNTLLAEKELVKFHFKEFQDYILAVFGHADNEIADVNKKRLFENYGAKGSAKI